jgi:hypothetical protein
MNAPLITQNCGGDEMKVSRKRSGARSGELRVQIPPVEQLTTVPYINLVDAHITEVVGSSPTGACSVAQMGACRRREPDKCRVADRRDCGPAPTIHHCGSTTNCCSAFISAISSGNRSNLCCRKLSSDTRSLALNTCPIIAVLARRMMPKILSSAGEPVSILSISIASLTASLLASSSAIASMLAPSRSPSPAAWESVSPSACRCPSDRPGNSARSSAPSVDTR